ncbi:chromosome replication/partitioning protein [Borrelia sp. RT1S]|uniref:chromosome replication/partitioning protein n=1 Tax=Borrelia sp. RT1S TaxID=2898580 RepID=UPI001E2B3FC1|nr:chromosome replication/partitioning protein [Borrelia sp. RT1S]UGQ17928.1 chromosome replication/partitioning protein [Borrelia sp. RT1S]
MNLKNLVMNLGNRIVDETEERGSLHKKDHGALYDEKEIKLNRFKEINQTIRAIASQELLGKIELMKLLAEIHDDFLYSVAGLKSFEEYIKDYTPVAKTTAYLFVKLGRMLKAGEVTETDIVQIGLSRLRNA